MQTDIREYSPKPFAKFERGVVLLESLIAVLIFSLGVLGIVGLQATMIKNTSDSKYRSEASFIAQQRIGQMWADTANLNDYEEEDTDISERLPNGTRTVAPISAGIYTVTVRWQQPGEPARAFTTTVNIVGG